jgi:predicted nucleotidyltransferase
MRINPRDRIAGVPILEIRRLFRRRYGEWSSESIRAILKLSPFRVAKLISELHAVGYIEESKKIDGRMLWQKTLDGCSLANAPAAKPLRRETADRLLDELLIRVRYVNANRRFLLKVTRVVVFGSYLTEADRLGDIDLAVALEPKQQDPIVGYAQWRKKLRQADRDGIRFANSAERVWWPEIEVRKFLKSRSRAISLHDIDDGIFKTAKFREVFREENHGQASRKPR